MKREWADSFVVCGEVGLDASPGKQALKDYCPKDVPGQIKKARGFAGEDGFAQYILLRKADFFNYGFRLAPKTAGKRVKKGDREEIARWIGERGDELRSFVMDVWGEYLALDNVVAMWWDEARFKTRERVRLLAPERCEYSDRMGIEVLKFEHGLTPEQIRLIPDKTTRERYAASQKVQLSEEFGEHFRVLKRAPVGEGFGSPRMKAVFRVLAQKDYMESGEFALGYASRTVVRQHKIGHEIKAGPRAGQGAWFYKKKRADAIRKFFEGRMGFMDLVTNFDHEIGMSWVDSKLFDASKWESPKERMIQWAGALAAMLYSKGVVPFLMPLLRAEATGERERVGIFLGSVINQVFAPPVAVRCVWSNRCFTDPRTASELLKFGVQQGATSLRTFNEETGSDHDLELVRKEEEQKDRKFLMPLFDAAHGNEPGNGGGRENGGGRPEGAGDPEG